MPDSRHPTLVRAIGRWSLAALTINCIIGSGIFGLPSVISGLVGSAASPFAWLFAAAATALIMACFAEVSSRFEDSGGVYLYSRTAFGRVPGIAVAWFGWLGRLTAAAANANLFVIYLAEFWPNANAGLPRFFILVLLFGVLTLVNYIGVKQGTLQSNIFTGAKLITLGAFIFAALLFLVIRHQPLVISLPTGPASKWLHPILLLIFAYGGFETALTPSGEVKNPRRDYPFALLIALIACIVIYTLTQLTIVSLLPPSFMTERPMASAAQIIFGRWGALLVTVGVLIATYGYLSANILGFPRILFAMAEHGDMPSVFARVHSKFRTPHIPIVVFAILVTGFSMARSFQWNLFISAISRLIYYATVCAALPVLRRKPGVPTEKFHLPFGNVIAVLAIAISLFLFPKLDTPGLVVMSILVVCVIVNSVWAARAAHSKERASGT